MIIYVIWKFSKSIFCESGNHLRETGLGRADGQQIIRSMCTSVVEARPLTFIEATQQAAAAAAWLASRKQQGNWRRLPSVYQKQKTEFCTLSGIYSFSPKVTEILTFGPSSPLDHHKSSLQQSVVTKPVSSPPPHSPCFHLPFTTQGFQVIKFDGYTSSMPESRCFVQFLWVVQL